MAAGHIFRELLIFIFCAILLKPLHFPKAYIYENSVPVDQLGMFFAGQHTSVVKFEAFTARTRNASYHESGISCSKQVTLLLRLSKLTLLAELNISAYLFFCGDVELNPGPDDFNTFNLPQ